MGWEVEGFQTLSDVRKEVGGKEWECYRWSVRNAFPVGMPWSLLLPSSGKNHQRLLYRANRLFVTSQLSKPSFITLIYMTDLTDFKVKTL
jgi:hypothetical protein